jgi:hypothetical protein
LREEFTETIRTWSSLWQRGEKLPLLRTVAVLPGQHAIQDTRRCAIQEFYVPDKGEYDLLGFLELPRRRSDVQDSNEAALENLLRRSFVVDHEGFLINVVTSPHTGSAIAKQNAYG